MKKKPLSETHSDVADEWHPTKNDDLVPDDVTYGSGKKVWWICKREHEWIARVADRTSGSSCPYCSNRAVGFGNDLLTKIPTLAKQWHPTKNGKLTPDKVHYQSHSKVWWICDKGHEWETTVKVRARGANCPFCSHRYASEDYNLQISHPEITLEWHPTLNILKPHNVTPASEKRVWWLCSRGHEWESTVKNRTTARTGCPYCAGKKVSLDNCLATLYPDVASEWHPNKNENQTPYDLTYGSAKKVWWLCDRGHEWIASVKHRTNGRGCPMCHSQTSRLEVRIYVELRSIFKEVEWRSMIYGYECDIFIPKENIGIEIDGGHWHKDKRNQDIKKNTILKAHGIRVLRVRGEGLEKINDYDVTFRKKDPHIKTILKLLNSISEKFSLSDDSRRKLDSYIDIGEVSDQYGYRKIISMLPSPPKNESLEIMNPEVCQEWYFEKNDPLIPSMFSPGSGKKVWWLCVNGHEWQAAISNRTKDNPTGCPYCSRRVAFPDNNLKLSYPDIAAEWLQERNGKLTPTSVVPGSHRKVWWRCHKGHEYEMIIGNRTRQGQGCPFCANKRVCKDNSLASLNPDLAAQWIYEKNRPLTPKDVVPGSNRRVWWKCDQGHQWEAPIERRSRGIGCPYCSGRRVTVECNLMVVNPGLASEWHPTKNEYLTPDQVAPNSHLRVWWQCDIGHEWRTTVNSRAKGTGCPQCNPKGKTPRRKATAEYNLATEYPLLAEEWHPIKNNKREPIDFTPGSGKKIWWICKMGHEWEARIQSRTRGTGCPYCSARKKWKGSTKR